MSSSESSSVTISFQQQPAASDGVPSTPLKSGSNRDNSMESTSSDSSSIMTPIIRKIASPIKDTIRRTRDNISISWRNNRNAIATSAQAFGVNFLNTSPSMKNENPFASPNVTSANNASEPLTPPQIRKKIFKGKARAQAFSGFGISKVPFPNLTRKKSFQIFEDDVDKVPKSPVKKNMEHSVKTHHTSSSLPSTPTFTRHNPNSSSSPIRDTPSREEPAIRGMALRVKNACLSTPGSSKNPAGLGLQMASSSTNGDFNGALIGCCDSDEDLGISYAEGKILEVDYDMTTPSKQSDASGVLGSPVSPLVVNYGALSGPEDDDMSPFGVHDPSFAAELERDGSSADYNSGFEQGSIHASEDELIGCSDIEFDASRVLFRFASKKLPRFPRLSPPKSPFNNHRVSKKHNAAPLKELPNAAGPHGFFGKGFGAGREMISRFEPGSSNVRVWRNKRRISPDDSPSSPVKVRRHAFGIDVTSTPASSRAKRSAAGDGCPGSSKPSFSPKAKALKLLGLSTMFGDAKEDTNPQSAGKGKMVAPYAYQEGSIETDDEMLMGVSF